MIQVGDTVRLKAQCTTWVRRHDTATVTLIRKESVRLDRRLQGFQWWHMNDLAKARNRGKADG